VSTARLQELEAIVAKLTLTARALPAGKHREGALREIEGFRVQIAALHRIDTRLAEVGLKVKK
jgi:hypothetical protein